MKVLITGGNGQLGDELKRAFAPLGDVTAPERAILDLGNPTQIVRCVRDAKPDLIVNAGAYTAVDRAETEIDSASAVNAAAPAILAEEANRLDIPIIHYSTDYVFAGSAAIPYQETDATGPLNVYGQTKLDGELAVAQVAKRYAVFRVSWLYGNRRQNFMLTMLRLARERESLSVVGDQFGAPTWVRQIADVTRQAVIPVAQRADLALENGVYHLSAAGKTSWHAFAAAILAQTQDPQRRVTAINSITTAEYKTPAQRPPYSVLNCAKIERALGLKMVPWQEQLRACLAERESSAVF
jgi:dTDP-4-dehydrorhamnose reductase